MVLVSSLVRTFRAKGPKKQIKQKLGFDECERIYKALANRRRLMIIGLLVKNSELSMTEIAYRIKLSFKATSKHLALLRSIQIVNRTQRGFMAYYSLPNHLPPPVSQFINLFC